MDSLEKIIRGNRGTFSNLEPDDGHFDRFGQRLNKRFKKRWQFNMDRLLKVAAVLAIALFVGDQVYDRWLQPVEGIQLGDISSEYRETEVFYTTSINSGMTELNDYFSAGKLNPDEQGLIRKELQEMDKLYRELQNELKTNPSDERIIKAMVDYYQTKQAILERILDELKNVQNQNDDSHENKTI